MKNKKWRKAGTLLCVVSVGMTGLVGCGGTRSIESEGQVSESVVNKNTTTENKAEKSTTDKKEDKKEKRTVSAMLVQSQNLPGLQAMFEKLEKEENIILDAQVIPDDQYTNMLQMKSASGDLPDIILNNAPHIFHILDPEKQLYDFSEEEWASKLKEPDITKMDGKIYAFPLKASSGMHAIIYNKDIFDEKNLQIPKTPEEFAKLCESLKADGIAPILVASDLWVPQIWMTSGFARAMGSEEAAEEMTQKVYSGEKKFSDYPELVSVIDDFLAMKKKGWMNDDVATLTWDDAWNRMSKREGAMIMGEGAMIGSQQATYPDTHFGVFNYPASFDDKDLISAAKFSSSFVANKNSKNIDTVKEIFNKFSTPEYGDLYFQDGNSGFPAFDGIDGGKMQQDIVDLYESHVKEHKDVKEMNLQWSKIEQLQGTYLWVYYSEALNKGNMDGKQILDKYNEDVIKFLKENDK